jgi:hypothetical protein
LAINGRLGEAIAEKRAVGKQSEGSESNATFRLVEGDSNIPCDELAAIVTEPWSVNFTALLIRLSSTWVRRR